MRSEQEMLELIINTAKQDERIRAVILNGSRANPNARRDFFQDYDILYVVTEMEAFKNDPHWIDCFGERMILQLPDDMVDPPPEGGLSYAYLMQFMDGNRIDLTIFPRTRLDQLERDSLSVLLLDKDGIIGPLAPATDQDYLPKPPSAKAFFDCCNEFWWVCPYVAKGLWRGEIIYARFMLDQAVREQLMKMLDWYVGAKYQFTKSPGKFGKHLDQVLEPELWQLLLRTHAEASYEKTWEALEAMCALFRRTAMTVAEYFGYSYLFEEDKRVSAHLKHVRALPQEAQEMYP